MIEVSVRTFYVSDKDGITLAPVAIFLLKDDVKPVDVAAVAKALEDTFKDVPVTEPRQMTADEVCAYRAAEERAKDVFARPYSDGDDDNFED